MDVKIYIPSHILTKIEANFVKYAGRQPSKKELIRFLENDIIEVYDNHFADGLDDAVHNVA